MKKLESNSFLVREDLENWANEWVLVDNIISITYNGKFWIIFFKSND